MSEIASMIAKCVMYPVRSHLKKTEKKVDILETSIDRKEKDLLI